MKVTPVLDDVYQLALLPRAGINAYIVGDILVDAGLSFHGGAVIKALKGRPIGTHVVTHAHGDHVGGSRKVSDALGVPVWCGAGDADAVSAGRPVAASRAQSLFRWKPVDVARELREGDELGSGFTVLDAPGHSPGQIVLWRERDRTLICADVFLNMNFYTAIPGLNEPPRAFTVDLARNREAARRLAELEPDLVLFGHGRPLRDSAKLAAFARSLPQS